MILSYWNNLYLIGLKQPKLNENIYHFSFLQSLRKVTIEELQVKEMFQHHDIFITVQKSVYAQQATTNQQQIFRLAKKEQKPTQQTWTPPRLD